MPVAKNSAHGRAASSGGYFTNHRRASYYPSISGPRVRSPLAVGVVDYKPGDDVTFDKFLKPHRSGKGEVYRGAHNTELKVVKDP